ncbi:hypothetical protein FRC04_010833, partial [Tulasnella sp. 424]
VHSYPFHKLFDRNVPPSLIDCIAGLIQYDPERRLTAQQCKDRPYWKENTQRETIATQPQAPHDRHFIFSTAAAAAEADGWTTAAASLAGMRLYGGPSQQQQQPQQSQQQQAQLAGFTPGHARSQFTNHAGPSRLGFPAMSPRDIHPSHYHPHSSGKLKPFNAAGHDVVPPTSIRTFLSSRRSFDLELRYYICFTQPISSPPIPQPLTLKCQPQRQLVCSPPTRSRSNALAHITPGISWSVLTDIASWKYLPRSGCLHVPRRNAVSASIGSSLYARGRLCVHWKELWISGTAASF